MDKDKYMYWIAARINDHPGLNIRVRWYDSDMLIPTNDLDYWLAISNNAYRAAIINKEEMINVLLILKANGIESKEFNRIAKEVIQS